MPDPISNPSHSAYEASDPSISSCEATVGRPPVTASGPPIVSIAPVVIEGDAGAQVLLRQYDSQTCATQLQDAKLACAGIGLGVLNALEGGPLTGIASAFVASVLCGKDLRAAYDCERDRAALAASRADVIDDCHERGGVVKPGASSNEIVCEVAR